MTNFIIRRTVQNFIMLFFISMLIYMVLNLAPGGPFDMLALSNPRITQSMVDRLNALLDLDKPVLPGTYCPVDKTGEQLECRIDQGRYFRWLGKVIQGDWGKSWTMQKGALVTKMIGQRLGYTLLLMGLSLLLALLIAVPIGVISAVKQYSWMDYVFTFLSFGAVSLPGFFLALIIMYFAQTQLNLNVGGLFSEKFIDAPWNWDKVVDMFKHLWIPVVILAVEGTAGGIRTTRANLLDELNKPYVELARAKGLTEGRLIWKYPVRVALNPFFSTVGWSLANLISGATLISVVLSLQTTGPMQLRALMSQDMYLAGSFLLLLSALTVVGTLVSDILLAWVDPRIRMEA